MVESRTSFPIPMVICQKEERTFVNTTSTPPNQHVHGEELRRTSLSTFIFVLSPSMASSFWPSRSSAKRVAANDVPSIVADEALWYPWCGDERPEWGGVGT